LIGAAGFALKRVKGSHHIYTRPGVVEIINVQPKGNAAKPYQVRQVLDVIEKYGIEVG
jgi:predicted RNA binding protein YcfA (HicA-like mRNA interferase family)